MSSDQDKDNRPKGFDERMQWLGHKLHPYEVVAKIIGIILAAFLGLFGVHQPAEESLPWILGGILVGVVVVTIVRIRKTRLTTPSKDPASAIKRRFMEDYEQGDLATLLLIQLFLRLALVNFSIHEVSFAVPDEALSQSGEWLKISNLTFWNLPVSELQLRITVIYLLLSGGQWVVSWYRNTLALKDHTAARRKGILWPPAVIDCVAITLISLCHKGQDPYYHLGYLIPALGVWLFSAQMRGMYLFLMIGLGLLAPALQYWFISASDPSVKILWLLGNTLPKIIFWTAAAVPLVVLRQLRKGEMKQKRILETVCDYIDYSVFLKDENRVFRYVNRAMLRRLEREDLDEVINRTDADLKIDTPEYEASDKLTLRAPEPEKYTYHELEANFESGRQGEKILTTKRPIVENGVITGLVGVCEPGDTLHLARILANLVDHMPYYVTVKNVDHHIVWANTTFCKKDAMADLPEILKGNNGRGLTDCDLYGEEVGAKYQEGDAQVIRRARTEIDNGRDPLAIPVYSHKELHYFGQLEHGRRVPGKVGRWVQVTKIPWVEMNRSGGYEVKGVLVYFHDIHEGFCREGMLGRWIQHHLARAIMAVEKQIKACSDQQNGRTIATVKAESLLLLHLCYRIGLWTRNAIEEKTIQLSCKTFVLAEMQWMERAFCFFFEGGNVEFIISEKGPPLEGDRSLVEAVVMLFVLNAYRASVAGNTDSEKAASMGDENDDWKSESGLKVKVYLTRADNLVNVIVEDSGQGIDEEEKKKILRGEKLPSNDKLPGGGIFLAWKLAHVVRGMIDLQSAGAKGGTRAIFSFRPSDLKAVCAAPPKGRRVVPTPNPSGRKGPQPGKN